MTDTTQSYAPGTHPDLPPPSYSRGPIKWMRDNLFSSPTNTVLTLLGLPVPDSMEGRPIDLAARPPQPAGTPSRKEATR